MITLLLRPTRFLAYCAEFSKTPYLMKLKNSYIYHLSGEVLFIVLLTFVAATFNPGYYAAGKGLTTSNQGYTK